MHIAYVDESGDRGATGSRTYTLGCVLVRASQWPAAFDGVIGFRRYLHTQLGIPVRAELKANYLLKNRGPLRALAIGERGRGFTYRGLLRLQETLELKAFAIVIDKQRLRGGDPLQYAWTYLIQRLERHSADGEVLIVHDEGEADTIRKIARKARRAGTAGSQFGGSLRRPFTKLLDDPVPKASHESYFLQLADLVAFAGFRKCFPPAQPSAVCDGSTWDQLGAARYAQVNIRGGGPALGIVLWPR
ncbi:MAG: DUF3800 domain-containing protein [Vicinamibacterales bacterium]